MPSFRKLCEIIVQTNGNPTVKEVLECGYTLDDFIRLCQVNIDTETLVKKAQKSLNKMQIKEMV
jgi:hypothetical protein